jgi:hypothetical protein
VFFERTGVAISRDFRFLVIFRFSFGFQADFKRIFGHVSAGFATEPGTKNEFGGTGSLIFELATGT